MPYNGLNLTDKSKMLGMFKRLHDHVEGTGVGLYIIKKTMKKAGRRIEVESKVNEGATFWLYFRKPIRLNIAQTSGFATMRIFLRMTREKQASPDL